MSRNIYENKMSLITDTLLERARDSSKAFHSGDDIIKHTAVLLDENGFRYDYYQSDSTSIYFGFKEDVRSVELTITAKEDTITYHVFFPFSIPSSAPDQIYPHDATFEIFNLFKDSKNVVIIPNRHGELYAKHEYHFEEPCMFHEGSFWKGMKIILDSAFTHFDSLANIMRKYFGDDAINGVKKVSVE